MSAKLKLYELTGSPNNVKARIALGYKGLDYERQPIALDNFPGNRTSLVELSRQPRTPVLQHGDTVIFDSRGILRYLEANFPDTPRLFRDSYEEHGEIEQWELFASTQLGEPVGMLFNEAFSPNPDANAIAKANRLLHERTGRLEDKLSTGDFLVGDHMTAADIGCASPLYLADMTAEHAQTHPIAAFFHKHMTLGDGRDKTYAWVRRIVSHDPVVGRK